MYRSKNEKRKNESNAKEINIKLKIDSMGTRDLSKTQIEFRRMIRRLKSKYTVDLIKDSIENGIL